LEKIIMSRGLNLIRLGRRAFPRSKTGSGSTALNGGIIHMDLDRVWLVNQYQISVSIAQAFTGVPTSVDVRRFFSQMQLIVDKGDGQKMSFHAAYDLARINNQPPAPVNVLAAASTCNFVFEVNLQNDGAIGDIVTAALTGKYSTLALELTIAPDATNGFIGGTVPLVAQYQVEVMPREMRDQTPLQRDDMSSGWGVAEHAAKQQANVPVTVGGLEYDCVLTAGGKMRYVQMHGFDAASFGNLTDAIWNNGARISMEVDGFKYYDNTLVTAIKQSNVADHNVAPTGYVLLDFGDDPHGWQDQRNAKDIKFHLSLPASANLPAAGRIEFCQDYTKGLENLKGALKS
jgi:hypothetical protein